MRVFLVGRSADRDRLRPQLIEAGIEVAAEALSQPVELPDHIDAIVTARSNGAGAIIRPGSDRPRDLLEPLTTREREVLALVAEGLPNKAIAAALDISDQTVKFHVASIIAKLGAVNRTDAVRRAVRRGLVAI